MDVVPCMKAAFTFFMFLFFHQVIGQVWQEKMPFPGPGRDDGIAFTIQNYGYCVTGKTTGFAGSNTLYKYNVITNTWEEKASFKGEARQYTTAFSIGNKAYLLGGYSKSGVGLAEVWCYDGELDNWTQKNNFPGGARWGAFAFAIGTQGYFGCGTNMDTVFNDFWKYNSKHDSWIQLDDFPGGARREGVACAVGGFGFAGLGLKDYTNEGFYKDWYVFDPLTIKWKQLADYPGGFNAYGKSESMGGFVVVGTGMNENQVFNNDFWRFDLSNWSWSLLPKMPGEAIRGAASFSINQTVYIITGLTASFNRSKELHALEFPAEKLSIQIYPNPSEGKFHVQSNNGNQALTLNIFNAMGKLVVHEMIESDFYDYSFLAAGLYFLQVSAENGEQVKKQLIIL